MAATTLIGLSINCQNTIYIGQTISVTVNPVPVRANAGNITWVAKNSSGGTINSSSLEITKSPDGKSGTIKLKTALPNDASSFLFSVTNGDYTTTTTIEQAETIQNISLNLGVGATQTQGNNYTIGLYSNVRCLFNITSNLGENSINFPKSYSILNTRIASVTQTGIIMGIRPGTTKLICRSSDYIKYRVECTITVEKPTVTINPISDFNAVIDDIYTGRERRVYINTTPLFAEYDNSTISSSNTSVVYAGYRTDKRGNRFIIVRGISPGDAVITLSIRDKSNITNIITKTVPVTVKMMIDSIKFKQPFITLSNIGDVYSVPFSEIISITPSFSSSLASILLWSAKRNSNVSISKNNTDITFTAIRNGINNVNVVSPFNKRINAAITVIVENQLSSFTTNIPAIFNLDATFNVTVKAIGANGKPASYNSIRLTSSNPAVASIYNNTSMIAVGAGNCIITTTVVGSNQTLTSTKSITVLNLIKNINVTPKLLTLNNTGGPGNTGTLSAEIFPSNATNTTVVWSSSAPLIASIPVNSTNTSVVVTGLRIGRAIITARSQDTGKVVVSIPVNVTIQNPIVDIQVSPNRLMLDITNGSVTSTLTDSVFPSNAANTTVVWKSSAPLIASIPANSNEPTVIVTGLKVGSAVITATSQDTGTVIKSIPVTVGKRILSVAIADVPTDLYTGTSAKLRVQVTPADAIAEIIIWEKNSAVSSMGDISNSGVIISPSNNDIENAPGNTLTIPVNALSVSVTNQFMSAPVTALSNTVINVKAKVAYLSIGSFETLPTSNSMTVIPIILPLYASNKVLRWSSDNSAIATVNSSGLVTKVASGTTMIKAITTDGSSITASLVIQS